MPCQPLCEELSWGEVCSWPQRRVGTVRESQADFSGTARKGCSQEGRE